MEIEHELNSNTNIKIIFPDDSQDSQDSQESKNPLEELYALYFELLHKLDDIVIPTINTHERMLTSLETRKPQTPRRKMFQSKSKSKPKTIHIHNY